jgi:hypothetical protein
MRPRTATPAPCCFPSIDSSHRTTDDVEAGKIVRQVDRVDALAGKVERKYTADDTAWTKARVLRGRLPEEGKPIKVGHHFEGCHRNAIVKASSAIRKSEKASVRMHPINLMSRAPIAAPGHGPTRTTPVASYTCVDVSRWSKRPMN